jgi:DNA-binding response OmpR family regulator
MASARPYQRSLVLVIEDDQAIAALLTEVVHDIVGANSLSVTHPDRAPHDRDIDLVVTDLVGNDTYRPDAGRGYLARLRSRFSGIPVILLTGQQWARDAARTLPVDQVVAKPFDLDDLADRIRDQLRAARRSVA